MFQLYIKIKSTLKKSKSTSWQKVFSRSHKVLPVKYVVLLIYTNLPSMKSRPRMQSRCRCSWSHNQCTRNTAARGPVWQAGQLLGLGSRDSGWWEGCSRWRRSIACSGICCCCWRPGWNRSWLVGSPCQLFAARLQMCSL